MRELRLIDLKKKSNETNCLTMITNDVKLLLCIASYSKNMRNEKG